ncbi:MAG TPA: hypothetical protein VM940_17105 [Chthoniobacterales bacterium]|jgi:hypothetical protein|nr:hypothetical protein [Chthoniobacterales bacterium]
MKAHYYDLSIRVLIYRESTKFVAHALDLDILGYGDTENAAKKELEGLVNNQLSFAACMGSPESVNFPAPKEFFERWEKARQGQLQGIRVAEKSTGFNTKATVLVYTPEELKKLRAPARKRDFEKAVDHQDLAAVA